MLTNNNPNTNNAKYSETFEFNRGNCGEPDWLVEDDFLGNWIKVYEEYSIEYNGNMVESSYLYADATKLDYEGWYNLKCCYKGGSFQTNESCAASTVHYLSISENC